MLSEPVFRVWRFATLLSSLTLLAACDNAPQQVTQPQYPPLATLVVEPVQAMREQVWDGVVEAVDDSTIAAQTNARVLELPFDVGDRVAKGDILVRFSDIEQQTGRKTAAANVAAARAEYRNAETDWQRMQDIFARDLIARAQLDAATARRDAARAALDAAEASLKNASQQVDYTVVRAPFNGVVTRRYVQVGEAVQSGPPAPQPLIALAALDTLRIEVVVPQSAVAAIRKFHTATVVLDDDRRVNTPELTVFPYADPATHTFRIRVRLPAESTSLYPGMTVKVVFAVGETTRLLVPVSTLVRRGELSGVYVVGSDHAVNLRQLRLGHHYGDSVEVLAGLKPGERITLEPEAAALYLTKLHAAE